MVDLFLVDLTAALTTPLERADADDDLVIEVGRGDCPTRASELTMGPRRARGGERPRRRGLRPHRPGPAGGRSDAADAAGDAHAGPRGADRDEPRWGWRGVHLDVARHFFDVATSAASIDLAAAHRLNRVHLHLNDDQGWRVEVPGWPRLTEVGAWRASTPVGREEDGVDDHVALRRLLQRARTWWRSASTRRGAS